MEAKAAAVRQNVAEVMRKETTAENNGWKGAGNSQREV